MSKSDHYFGQAMKLHGEEVKKLFKKPKKSKKANDNPISVMLKGEDWGCIGKKKRR